MVLAGLESNSQCGYKTEPLLVVGAKEANIPPMSLVVFLDRNCTFVYIVPGKDNGDRC